MIKTTYTCDICGKDFTRGGLYEFGSFYKSCKHKNEFKTKTKHGCVDCLKRLGVVCRTEEEKRTMPPPPTVEDLFRQILDLVGGFHD